MFTVTKTPAYFEVAFDYNPYIKDQVKAISGSRWNPVKKIMESAAAAGSFC
jgi:hypothetical protein